MPLSDVEVNAIVNANAGLRLQQPDRAGACRHAGTLTELGYAEYTHITRRDLDQPAIISRYGSHSPPSASGDLEPQAPGGKESGCDAAGGRTWKRQAKRHGREGGLARNHLERLTWVRKQIARRLHDERRDGIQRPPG
jgi:hypothetical protein